MKVVYSCDCGGAGFELPYELSSMRLNYDQWHEAKELRVNPTLIKYIEEHKDEDGSYKILDRWGSTLYTRTKLAIAELPDKTTDFLIIENAGRETIYYVVDGKIKEY